MKDSAPFLKPPATNSSSFDLAKFLPMQVCLTEMRENSDFNLKSSEILINTST